MFCSISDSIRKALNIKIDKTPNISVDKSRYLGLVIDCKVRFKMHVTSCIQKFYANLKMLIGHKYYLSKWQKDSFGSSGLSFSFKER